MIQYVTICCYNYKGIYAIFEDKAFKCFILLNHLTNDEVFLLLFAVVVHDIGMLTQSEDDLEEYNRSKFARVFADLPMWIRRTHIHRLEKILCRLFKQKYPESLTVNSFYWERHLLSRTEVGHKKTVIMSYLH